MRALFFDAEPYDRAQVTQALESGADGIIAPPEKAAQTQALARCRLINAAELTRLTLASKEDEHKAAGLLTRGAAVMLRRSWEIIPVENLLAAMQGTATPGELILEAGTPEEAKLAAGILERGADAVSVPPQALSALRHIAAALRDEDGLLPLTEAVITEITPAGMGHRVCVDTLSRLVKGQGMLVGNSAAFTFLVNAETEPSEYVAPRPFRVNAGAVHAYALLPGD
ncbi:MAG: 3-dehydroquinate synthase II family protein, partial [Deltaproteobacteria bacterium]|nr:3-dehydroquinate synthase II family protein [Deltaproteobacteria bacterium]